MPPAPRLDLDLVRHLIQEALNHVRPEPPPFRQPIARCLERALALLPPDLPFVMMTPTPQDPAFPADPVDPPHHPHQDRRPELLRLTERLDRLDQRFQRHERLDLDHAHRAPVPPNTPTPPTDPPDPCRVCRGTGVGHEPQQHDRPECGGTGDPPEPNPTTNPGPPDSRIKPPDPSRPQYCAPPAPATEPRCRVCLLARSFHRVVPTGLQCPTNLTPGLRGWSLQFPPDLTTNVVPSVPDDDLPQQGPVDPASVPRDRVADEARLHGIQQLVLELERAPWRPSAPVQRDLIQHLRFCLDLINTRIPIPCSIQDARDLFINNPLLHHLCRLVCQRYHAELGHPTEPADVPAAAMDAIVQETGFLCNDCRVARRLTRTGFVTHEGRCSACNRQTQVYRPRDLVDQEEPPHAP